MSLEQGKSTSEYRLTQIGIGAGIGLQALNEVYTKWKNKDLTSNEVVTMALSEVSPENIVKLSDAIKSNGESYLGAGLALIMAVVYIAKRAVLKYFELKGQVAIEVAKINAQVEAIKAGYKVKITPPNEQK